MDAGRDRLREMLPLASLSDTRSGSGRPLAANPHPPLYWSDNISPDLDDSQKWYIWPSDPWQFTDPRQNDMPVLDSWTMVPLHGWKFPLTHFPIVSRSDLDTCPNRRRGKETIRKFWPQPKIGDLLTSDDLPMWFNCIMWYVIVRGVHNTHVEWWTAMTERF